MEWRSTHALAPSHTRALDARPAKRAARLLFKAFPFIVSTMCSVTRGRNSQPPRCGGPLRRVKRSFIFSSPLLFYFIIIPFGCCTSRSPGRCPPSFQTIILLIHPNSSHCSLLHTYIYIRIVTNHSITFASLRLLDKKNRPIRSYEPLFDIRGILFLQSSIVLTGSDFPSVAVDRARRSQSNNERQRGEHKSFARHLRLGIIRRRGSPGP